MIVLYCIVIVPCQLSSEYYSTIHRQQHSKQVWNERALCMSSQINHDTIQISWTKKVKTKAGSGSSVFNMKGSKLNKERCKGLVLKFGREAYALEEKNSVLQCVDSLIIVMVVGFVGKGRGWPKTSFFKPIIKESCSRISMLPAIILKIHSSKSKSKCIHSPL